MLLNINTELFCTTANYYRIHHRYPDGVYDSYEYHDFWDTEMNRCLNGYTVGGVRITGDHYWYLNHWPIWLTKTNTEKLYGEVLKNRRHGTRDFDFPAFWDVDVLFFRELELARLAGEHFIWLKPRGVGASYKGSSLAGKNYHCIPGSKSYMLAYSSEYLTGDGLFTKFLQGRNFHIKLHPDFSPDDRVFLSAFGKPSDFKKDINGMHFKASSDIDGQELGYMSEVMGVTLRDDIQKARGKRGILAILEEMGTNPYAETVFNILRSSVEEGDITYGMILGFGTGGTETAVFGAMEKMFYTPEAYNVRCFDNIYDEGMRGTKCAYFTPAYRNIAFKDSMGNSLEIEAKKYRDSQRDMALKSSDSNAIVQEKAEHPYTPQEAILRTSHSVLPSNEAREWYHRVINSGLDKMGVAGKLVHNGKKLEFKVDGNLVPILEFPHNIKKDLTGCIVQYYAPYEIGGKIPDNLYIIAHDPYAFDQSTDSESLGATYVYMQPSNFPGAGIGDKIVATYFGRPKTTDDYNKILFELAEYYNAKIGFENDRGDVIGYAKRHKKLDWLAEEFELAFDADISKSKTKRNFGMHIGSGKENLRMHKGNKYLADWLITGRGKSDDGSSRMNLHTIFCPATLKEISMYRSDGGNFDRISALRILAYYQKEIVYKEQHPQIQEHNNSSFFNRVHFQNVA